MARTQSQQPGRTADRPSDIPARGWLQAAKRVKGRVKEHHLTLNAAGVAFFAFLASVPALAALITIAGMVLSPQRAVEIVDDLLEAAPEEVSSVLSSQLETVAGADGGALSLGLVISLGAALWAASTAMQNLIEGVGIAYNEPDERGFVAKRGRALLLTLGAIVLFAATIAAIAVLPAVLGAADPPGAVRWLLNVLVWPLLGAGVAVALALVYRYGPDRRHAEWRWGSWGAGIAVVIWILASIGFQLYVSNFGNYNETYGSLAAVVILLLWLLISAFAVLLGAEINSELERQTGTDTTAGKDRPRGQRGADAADDISSN